MENILKQIKLFPGLIYSIIKKWKTYWNKLTLFSGLIHSIPAIQPAIIANTLSILANSTSEGRRLSM